MIKNRMNTDPIPVVRQHRPVRVRNFTTVAPGKIVPTAAFGLLRGDSCSGRVEVAIEMAETYEVLFNPMHARVNAWFVPKVALDRFQRNKTYFERAAVGDPITNEGGAPTIPFLETHEYAINPLYKHMGIPELVGRDVVTDYRESYNQIVRYAYMQRSKSLAERDLDDTTLATAIWGPNAFSSMVPNFDIGMIAGATPLTVVSAQMPVSGIHMPSPTYSNTGSMYETGGTGFSSGWVQGSPLIERDPDNPTYPGVFAQLSQDGITVSLANIDQARKLVEWAKLREQFEGHRDPYILETLMSGLPIDEQTWMMPMLLDSKMVEFSQVKRMATDGANLSNGVANGLVVTDLGINVPQNPYGGVVMITVEAFPEQLYERQADPYFSTTDLNELPRYDRDVMNPMPVVAVKNKEVDVSHATPEGRFAYAERNWKWANNPTRVGGDLFAPNGDAPTLIDRRVIYATEVANPALNTEFYLSTTLGREVFVDQTRDPFKVGIGGTLDVMGLTVIGEVHESEANFDAVRAEYLPLAAPEGA
ncbi:MAG: major capsid protein [Wigfec virus K19_56]|nr:MAG: major capsid protein [Wigfec virus K19_56]